MYNLNKYNFLNLLHQKKRELLGGSKVGVVKEILVFLIHSLKLSLTLLVACVLKKSEHIHRAASKCFVVNGDFRVILQSRRPWDLAKGVERNTNRRTSNDGRLISHKPKILHGSFD